MPQIIPTLRYLLRWIPITIAVGILAGSASALLLVSLNVATDLRNAHFWLIYLLAPAGLAVGLLYHHLGKSVERGNNLILDEIHNPQRRHPPPHDAPHPPRYLHHPSLRRLRRSRRHRHPDRGLPRRPAL